MGEHDDRCDLCDAIGTYLEIENPQEPSPEEASQSLPTAVERLMAPNERLAAHYRYRSERLLKCPQCGAYYLYRQWAPGGSEDVMHTYIHESVSRLSALQARVELDVAHHQAGREAEERGAGWVEAAISTGLGVQQELPSLLPRCGEIIGEAVSALEERARRLQELEQGASSTRRRAEAAERERRAMAYYAEVLADYAGCEPANEAPPELLERLRALRQGSDPAAIAWLELALERLASPRP